jgi:hypothetical protein
MYNLLEREKLGYARRPIDGFCCFAVCRLQIAIAREVVGETTTVAKISREGSGFLGSTYVVVLFNGGYVPDGRPWTG